LQVQAGATDAISSGGPRGGRDRPALRAPASGRLVVDQGRGPREGRRILRAVSSATRAAPSDRNEIAVADRSGCHRERGAPQGRRKSLPWRPEAASFAVAAGCGLWYARG